MVQLMSLVRGFNSPLSKDITFDVTSKADEVVLGALGSTLVKELISSSYFYKSCYSSYRKDITFKNYMDTIKE